MSEATEAETLRHDIEAKRRELGDTVEQLAAKADVKEQIREHSPDARRLAGIAAAVVVAFTLLVILRKRRR